MNLRKWQAMTFCIIDFSKCPIHYVYVLKKFSDNQQFCGYVII